MRRRNSTVRASYQVRPLLSIKNAPPLLSGFTSQKFGARPAASMFGRNVPSFAVPASCPASPINPFAGVPPPPGFGFNGFRNPRKVAFAKLLLAYNAAQEPVPEPVVQAPAFAGLTPLKCANKIGSGNVPVPGPK